MPNEAPTVWRGLDLQAECDRLAELEIVPRRLQLRPPLVELRRVPRIAPNGADGYAYLGLNRISITVWPACHMARTLSTLSHELAHLWCGRKHDDYWRSSYIELIREGYGIDPDMPTRDATWALDLAVERALARHLQAPDNPNPNPNQTRKKK